MKKFSLLILINTVIILNTFGYKFRDKSMVLFDCNLTIHSDLNKGFDKYLDLFPEGDNDIRIEKRIKSMLYSHLEDRLKMDLDLDILPIRSFTDKINYDDCGFPDASIQRAIQKSNSKIFFEVEIEIKENLNKGQTEFGNRITKMDSTILADTTNLNPFKPEITLSLFIYNNKGFYPIYKYEVIVQSHEVYTYDDSLFLNGIVNREPWRNRKTILNLFDRAVNDLIFKIGVK